MAERENWLHESSDNRGTTTFVVHQRNNAHRAIVKTTLLVVGGGVALSFFLISAGGGISILGYILLLLLTLFGGGALVVCALMALMSIGIRARVSFAVSPGQLMLIEKTKDKYPGAIDRQQVASLYIDGPRNSGQVSSSRLIVGPTAYVAAQAAAHTIGDMSSSIGRGMGAALAASRYSVTINAQAKTINLADALSQSEAEYLMHRIEAAWAA